MKRSHALAISLVLAVAVVAAGVAVFEAAGLSGASAIPIAANTSVDKIAKRNAQLDRYEKKLKAALANKPPKLPTLVQRSGATVSGGRVVYVQAPAPSGMASSGGGEPDDHYEDGGDDGHAKASGGGEDDD